MSHWILRNKGRITSGDCRLSLRESTHFRGAKGDIVFPAFLQAIPLGLSLLLLASHAIAEEEPTRLEPTLAEERLERQLREELNPVDMRADEGVGYVARLRLGRMGDRDSDSSLCVLLEDGKPLPDAHSLHAAIREQGEGRYSHWTASQLYFSAGDSSDPRTNERKYELVSEETFIRRTMHVTAASAHSSFSVPVPENVRVRPVRLVLRNLDKQKAVIPRLVRRGDPDLTSTAAIVKSITTDDMPDEQRAIAIWKLLVQWRYHDYPAEERGEVHDPVKLINVYGYGFCDDSAAAFCALASEAGMKTRSYGLSGHVVAEAFYDDAWHMFDADHEVIYRADDGSIASVSQLEAHPELITRTERDPLGFPSARMAEAYTTRDDNRPFQAASSTPSILRPLVGPGDQVAFDFADTRRVHRRTNLDRPLPQSFANGTWTRTMSLSEDARRAPRNVRIQWPYAILGGSVSIQSSRPRETATLRISSDGQAFEPLQPELRDGQTTVSLDDWISRQPSATYSFWLRTDHGAESLKLDTYFQFAPRAVAQVTPGSNEFDLFLSGANNAPSSDSRGMHVEVVWDELP